MAVLFPHDMAIRLISWSSLASSHMLFIRKIMRYPPNDIYMLYDPWKSQWFTLMIYPEKKPDFWWMVKSGQIMSDWWYTYHLPLWKIWLRQLGSSKSPIHGKKHVPNHQPVYIYIHIMVLLFPIYGGCSWNPPMSTGSHSQDADGPEACAARCMASPQHFSPRRPRSPVSFGGLQQISWDWWRDPDIMFLLAEHETGFTELGISKLNCNTGDRNHQDEQPTFETWHLRTHSTPSLSKHLGTSKHTSVIFTNNNFGYQYILYIYIY